MRGRPWRRARQKILKREEEKSKGKQSRTNPMWEAEQSKTKQSTVEQTQAEQEICERQSWRLRLCACQGKLPSVNPILLHEHHHHHRPDHHHRHHYLHKSSHYSPSADSEIGFYLPMLGVRNRFRSKVINRKKTIKQPHQQ